MQACQQHPTQTIHQHGLAVAERYATLITTGDGFSLPQWFTTYRDHLLADQPPPHVMWLYHEFHDCGKPFCRQVDDVGRQHFPRHAEVSASMWTQACGSGLIADLIRHDMDLHLLKPSAIDTFTRYDLAPALLLTALAEIHANAEMFGGTDSTSFKIKHKTLSRIGSLICQRLYNEMTP